MKNTISGEDNPDGKQHWKDESVLRGLYTEQQLTRSEIAEKFGCSKTTIQYWCEKFEIEPHDEGAIRNKDYRDPDVLERLYYEEGLSQGEMGERLGVHRRTIGDWMDKHGIDTIEGPRPRAVTVNCSNCGTEIERTPKELEEVDNPVCSQKCNGAVLSRKQSEKVTVNCHACGSELERHPYRVKNHDKQYCNHGCKAAGLSERYSGPGHPSWNRRQFICSVCGDGYSVSQSRIERGTRFCSHDCFRSWLSEEADAEHWQRPNWGCAGLEYYGDGWTAEKRETVRHRDGQECKLCSMTRESHYQRYSENLHVHHIRKARTVEKASERNNPSNLITLCRDCHYISESMAPLLPSGIKHDRPS